MLLSATYTGHVVKFISDLTPVCSVLSTTYNQALLLFFCLNNFSTLFVVRGYLVCKMAWLAIYSISNRRFRGLIKIHKQGKCAVNSQTKKRRRTSTFVAKAWMESAYKKMGDKMPDSSTIHLPCYLNFKSLYQYMVEDLTLAGEKEIIAYSQFCKLMNTDFKDVIIPKVRISQRKSTQIDMIQKISCFI